MNKILPSQMCRSVAAVIAILATVVVVAPGAHADAGGLRASTPDAGRPHASRPSGGVRPRLVVLVIVDGLPQRQMLAYRDQLAPDGFARFLDRGAWFSNAHYEHASTVTCPGHATVLTGAYAHRSGIIGNDWLDRVTRQQVYCAGDTSATYIGHTTRPLDGTSPKNLKAETVGDVLRQLDPRSKVVAVSAKDRGAIMPAGKLGTAYIYMTASGQFASSTYYMQSHPQWVTAFNERRLADAHFKTEWKALLPEAAYARSVPDNQTWFGPAGGGLPKPYGDVSDEAPGPKFYSDLMRGPFVDAMTLEFARAALAAERLGQDEVPDVLAVSLSGHDLVNHAYSAESRLSHDHFLQLDRMLQSFFKELDSKVGPRKYIAVLTADHGFQPAAEVSLAKGLDAGRLNSNQLIAKLNAGLQLQFGEGKWVSSRWGAGIHFDQALIASRTVDEVALIEATRRLLLAEPQIAAAFTRTELASGSRAGEPLFDAVRKSWHPELSADLQLVLSPYWVFGSSASGATHGTPHAYDTHVPIAFYGPAWIGPGKVEQRVGVADIAPTLAGLLRVPVPSSSEGKPLPLPKLLAARMGTARAVSAVSAASAQMPAQRPSR